ncbi:MAG: LamG-like jellyroll fold domain-containing protein [Candidatus Paceibacterota bacterium]|jgi:prepilin-type N-terminal cleavage/methylation domain-containing protein
MNKLFKTAFTLIELLVVIAIIGILSGLIVVSMNGSINSANDTKRKAGIDTIRKALTYYGALNGGTYPALSRCTIGGTCSFPTTFLELLPNIPTDPVSGNYSYSSNGTTFNVSATLSNSTYYNYSSLDGFMAVDNTSLVASWPMHEGSGSYAYDKAGINSCIIVSSSWINNTLTLDGVDDYIYAASGTVDLNNTDFCASSWMKFERFGDPTSGCGNPSHANIMHWVSGYNGLALAQASANNLSIVMEPNGTGSGVRVVYNINMTLDRWYFFLVNYNKTTKRLDLYVDGVLIGGGTSNPFSGIVAPFRLGGGAYAWCGNGYSKGKIDEARIYSRALSQIEVTALYNMQKANH